MKELSDKIIGAAIEVHKFLGPGLLESTYERCLVHELVLRGVHAERQKKQPINYKGLEIDEGYRIDISRVSQRLLRYHFTVITSLIFMNKKVPTNKSIFLLSFTLLLAGFLIPAQAQTGDAQFRKVIHWDMSEVDANGFIPNRIQHGPYADNHLMPEGVGLKEYPGIGRALYFDGAGAVARSTMLVGPHSGMRVTLMVKNGSESGQSILFNHRRLQVFKVAQSLRFRSSSFARPHWDDNLVSIPGFQTGHWRKVVAEFNPVTAKVSIMTEGWFEELDLPADDQLTHNVEFITIGDAMNANFIGAVAEVIVEVID